MTKDILVLSDKLYLKTWKLHPVSLHCEPCDHGRSKDPLRIKIRVIVRMLWRIGRFYEKSQHFLPFWNVSMHRNWSLSPFFHEFFQRNKIKPSLFKLSILVICESNRRPKSWAVMSSQRALISARLTIQLTQPISHLADFAASSTHTWSHHLPSSISVGPNSVLGPGNLPGKSTN